MMTMCHYSCCQATLALNWLPATSIQKRLKDATAPKEENEADEAEQVKTTTAVSAGGDSDP
jgi:hypothetical protein